MNDFSRKRMCFIVTNHWLTKDLLKARFGAHQNLKVQKGLNHKTVSEGYWSLQWLSFVTMLVTKFISKEQVYYSDPRTPLKF